MLGDWVAEVALYRERTVDEAVKRKERQFLENRTTWITECIGWVWQEWFIIIICQEMKTEIVVWVADLEVVEKIQLVVVVEGPVLATIAQKVEEVEIVKIEIATNSKM
jgi:hypothetical protein